MTECNRKSLSFSRLGRQEIVTNFDGGRLTSDAGGLLLREVDRRLGLTAGLTYGRTASTCSSGNRFDGFGLLGIGTATLQPCNRLQTVKYCDGTSSSDDRFACRDGMRAVS